MINELALMTGVDIPFDEAQLIIHQPKLKEIALVGELDFLKGCDILTLSKDKVKMDKTDIEQYSDFDILMQMMNYPNKKLREDKKKVSQVLSLIFPQYLFNFEKDKITFSLEGSEIQLEISNKNFTDFKKYVERIFCLQNQEGEYNPINAAAEDIANKLRKRHEQLSKIKTFDEPKSQNNKGIFSRELSILAVGGKFDLNMLSELTVYQFKEMFERWQLKSGYDIYVKKAFSFAGAKEDDKPEDWMKDLHPYSVY